MWYEKLYELYEWAAGNLQYREDVSIMGNNEIHIIHGLALLCGGGGGLTLFYKWPLTEERK